MLQRRHVWLAVVSAMLLLVTPLSAQVAPADTATTLASAGTADEQVTLRPGDVVRITIWREPDLSGEFPVDPNGVVTLPLLGDQRVTGIPVAGLRDVLVSKYRVQLRNPSITVTPLRRINLYGEVNRPGLSSVDPPVPLARLITLAGGRTGNGSLDRIRIIRDGEVVHERASANTSLNTIDVRSGDQVIVGQRSWLSRNLGLVLSIPGTIAGIIGLVSLIGG
ncbi:hypothetical protein BH20GEM2_BH20GEM2_15570 [soil metagenome]